MGYYTNRNLLIQNLDLLEEIHSAATRGKPLTLSFRPEDLDREHYRLNRLLKSTQVFTSFEGGRFVGLRELVKIKVDPLNSSLILSPSGIKAEVVRKSVHQALEELKEDKTSTVRMIEFYPTKDFNPSESEDDLKQLVLDCLSIGWQLHARALLTDEEGLISIGVSRKEEEARRGFAALNQQERSEDDSPTTLDKHPSTH